MNSVERVQAICKERNIKMSHLEKACGFANGYVCQLKKGTFPDDRIGKIAEYLDLSVEYLRTGEEKYNDFSPKSAKLVGMMRSDADISSVVSHYFELPEEKRKKIASAFEMILDAVD